MNQNGGCYKKVTDCREGGEEYGILLVGVITAKRLLIVDYREEGVIPNQELSGAKSELQGKMVGACSFL